MAVSCCGYFKGTALLLKGLLSMPRSHTALGGISMLLRGRIKPVGSTGTEAKQNLQNGADRV